jgi:hypothetical protein
MARSAAADVGAFYAARRVGPAPDTDALVLSFDGNLAFANAVIRAYDDGS